MLFMNIIFFYECLLFMNVIAYVWVEQHQKGQKRILTSLLFHNPVVIIISSELKNISRNKKYFKWRI